MNRRQCVLLLSVAGLGLGGCEKLAPYANPLSTQTLVLGVVNPIPERVAVPDQVLTMVFVADARDIADIEQAPVSGAELTLRVGDAEVPVPEVGSGLYVVTSSPTEEGIAYAADSTFSVVMDYEEESFESKAEAPAATGFEESGTCVSHGQDVTLHVVGEESENVLVTVYDAEGNETWSSVPKNASDLIDFLTADEDPGTVELPASAFPEADTVYAVGMAGVARKGEYSDNLNPALSHYVIGAMSLGAVGPFTDQAACDELAEQQ